MKQSKKVIAETVIRQQERFITKLEDELSDLYSAIEDKEMQIADQKLILAKYKGESK